MAAPRDRVAGTPAITGRLAQINVSAGGVPKRPVQRARVGPLGIEGDGHRNRRFHGGPTRALCLAALEVIERLRAEGHPIQPGSTGENLTISGLDFSALRPGDRLQLGDTVLIELTRYTAPCKNIAASFLGGDFTRISHQFHSGDSRIYARVLQGGEIAAGDPVRCVKRDA